ncbi:hypothetical protein WJU23_10890 [Prosthecobacter sp. SYSU 5D2]|uniref:hypothetical protein n=1 Tax=Prosthecobacter sp. SYSU 5D2 TaxID=3134134 RepID=UPI0031FECDA6
MTPSPTTPIVKDHPDGYRVEWPGYQRAFALFSVEGTSVIVTDIFRDANQPKGSAGQMLADAFRVVGICRPSKVRLSNILDTQPTLAQLQQGKPPAETVLGQVLVSLGKALGLMPVAWDSGQARGKPFIEATFG